MPSFVPGPEDGAAEVWTWSEEPLLGTRVAVRITGAAGAAGVAAALADRIFAECDRLERVFSVFDGSSALRRWCRGALPDAELPAELVDVLIAADGWQRRSGGAFSVDTGALMALWHQAEADGAEPSPAAVQDVLRGMATPPYEVRRGAVRRRRTPCAVDLNAIAKGAIVDRAAASWAGPGRGDGLDGLVVNAGGDLLHRGTGTVPVGIEDPQRPYDNAAPLTRVALGSAALATSGPHRRGFRVGGRWYGHVLDPRAGRPTGDLLSASVVAPDAMTADAVATVVAVLDPDRAMAFVDALPSVEAMVIDGSGVAWRSAGWAALELS